MLRPFKYVARAVLLEENGDEVIGEHTTEEVHLYSKSQVIQWLEIVDEFTNKTNIDLKPDSE